MPNYIDPENTMLYQNLQAIVDNKKREVSASFTGNWSCFDELIGFPPQFNENADPRAFTSDINGVKYGRVFTENIVRDANTVFIEPGKPKFLPGSFFNSDKTVSKRQAILKDLVSDEEGVDFKRIFEREGFKYDSRYYVFDSSFPEYMQYVNSMAAYVAARVGIPRNKARKISLSKGGNPFTSTMIPFFFEASGTKFSEGASNSTGQSKIAGSIKNMGEFAREANFLLNGKFSDEGFLAEARDKFTERIGSIISKLPGQGAIENVSNMLLGASNTALKCANLLFPEIWQESSFNKSLTLSFKFVSPYGDKVSIYNNVLFPIIMLLALSLPRQVGRQGYTSPFLLKAFCKGWFNCDLGMVESISIEKGGSDGSLWTMDALPIEAEVNVTIKDLYSTLMMTAGKSSFMLSNNTGLVEYLDAFAGINIVQPNIFDPIFWKGKELYWNVLDSFKVASTKIESTTIGKTGKMVTQGLTKGFHNAMEFFEKGGE